MEDVFMKYGMMIVETIVISILLAFAFQALRGTPAVPKEVRQSVEGDNLAVEFKIKELCEFCLGDNDINKDCYLLDVKLTSGSVTNNGFGGLITFDDELDVGEHLIKIRNKEGICEVIKIE